MDNIQDAQDAKVADWGRKAADRGVGTTIERGAMVTLTGSIGAVIQEFWPDIAKKLPKNKRFNPRQ